MTIARSNYQISSRRHCRPLRERCVVAQVDTRSFVLVFRVRGRGRYRKDIHIREVQIGYLLRVCVDVRALNFIIIIIIIKVVIGLSSSWMVNIQIG